MPAAYLIGLSYRGGWLWVATGYSGGCIGTSNGTFTTSSTIGNETRKAYETGQWVAPSLPACATGAGRLGQEQSMVPADPVSLDICYFRAGAKGQTRVPVADAGLVALAALLDRQPASTSGGSCQMTANEATFYTLIFGYRTGPPVFVSVAAGCTPAIFNGSLQTVDGAATLALVRHYVTP